MLGFIFGQEFHEERERERERERIDKAHVSNGTVPKVSSYIQATQAVH